MAQPSAARRSSEVDLFDFIIFAPKFFRTLSSLLSFSPINSRTVVALRLRKTLLLFIVYHSHRHHHIMTEVVQQYDTTAMETEQQEGEMEVSMKYFTVRCCCRSAVADT